MQQHQEQDTKQKWASSSNCSPGCARCAIHAGFKDWFTKWGKRDLTTKDHSTLQSAGVELTAAIQSGGLFTFDAHFFGAEPPPALAAFRSSLRLLFSLLSCLSRCLRSAASFFRSFFSCRAALRSFSACRFFLPLRLWRRAFARTFAACRSDSEGCSSAISESSEPAVPAPKRGGGTLLLAVLPAPAPVWDARDSTWTACRLMVLCGRLGA